MIRAMKKKKNIRRFTEDVLSKELRASIREMATSVSQEVARKVMQGQKKF